MSPQCSQSNMISFCHHHIMSINIHIFQIQIGILKLFNTNKALFVTLISSQLKELQTCTMYCAIIVFISYPWGPLGRGVGADNSIRGFHITNICLFYYNSWHSSIPLVTPVFHHGLNASGQTQLDISGLSGLQSYLLCLG